MTGNTLKLMMMLLMVLDHIPKFVPPEYEMVFHVITRCVGVFFGFMLVEGFQHTSNKLKYFSRLVISATVMFVGNTLINTLMNNPEYSVHNNIFLTLTAGFILLVLSEKIKESRSLGQGLLYGLLLVGILVVGAAFTEGGAVVLPFILLTYVTTGHNKVRYLLYLVFSGLLFMTSYVPYETTTETLQMLAFNSDFCFILVIPFLLLYNGKKGNSSLVSKWGFYLFYPAHLWLISLIPWYFKL